MQGYADHTRGRSIRALLAYMNRGVARSHQGDLANAIHDYDQAIQLDPKDAEAYYNWGLTYKAQG